MEQSYGTINGGTTIGVRLVSSVKRLKAASAPGQAGSLGAAERVSTGILLGLERQRLVPGQRLIETDLAVQFGVGRNAVREAIQQLAARGIVDLSRNRSPSIRRLALGEALDVLDVAEVMTGLLARTAAQKFDRARHLVLIEPVTAELAACEKLPDFDSFNHTRRRFYRALLDIADNGELRRMFQTLHMEIIYAQYRSTSLQEARFADYRLICAAVRTGDAVAASAAAKRHVRRVRDIVRSLDEWEGAPKAVLGASNDR